MSGHFDAGCATCVREEGHAHRQSHPGVLRWLRYETKNYTHCYDTARSLPLSLSMAGVVLESEEGAKMNSPLCHAEWFALDSTT